MIEDTVKLELIKWILTIDDPEVLNSLLKFRDTIPPAEDWYDSLDDHQKELIKQGEKELDEGKSVSSEEFWKRFGRKIKNGVSQERREGRQSCGE